MCTSRNKADLQPFFTPRRIALVGASEQGMYPAGILRNLVDNGFPGSLYPVNPGRQSVFGLPCYPDLTQTPERADLAVLTVPRGAVLPVLHQCVEAGVPAAVVISAGFAEADEEGRRLQQAIVDFLHNRPLRVVGPNCAGLANVPARVIATRLPVPPLPGSISLVSQSGALMMALYGLFYDRGLGLDRLLSVGNQVDVTLAHGLAHLATAPHTAAIGAFVEGLVNGGAFVAALQDLLRAGKPLVLVKSGRTAVGQRAALTHTAALGGSQRVFEAVCRQFGVISVGDIGQMVNTLQVLAALGPRMRKAQRLAIITQSGGLGSLSADLAQEVGLDLPPFSNALQSRIRNLPFMLPYDRVGNPADVHGAALVGENTAKTLAPFLEDDESGAVLLLLAKSSVRRQDAETAEAIISVTRDYEKPLFVVWVGQRRPLEPLAWPAAVDMLVQAGIPVFSQPSECLRALGLAMAYGRFRQEWLQVEET